LVILTEVKQHETEIRAAGQAVEERAKRAPRSTAQGLGHIKPGDAQNPKPKGI